MMILMNIYLKHFVDRFMRDKNGSIVLMQFPNVPLLGWMLTAFVAYIVPSSGFSDGFSGVSRGLLFVWAYLELTSGITYFRRILGGAVMTGVIVGYFR